MSVPAALTWTALLPADARFDSSPNVPQWLSKLLTSKDGRHPVSVYCGEDVSRVCDKAVIAVNCRGTSGFAARYPYLRRFAVLPSLENARWFIPLDSPAVSVAAFSLYSPAKFSARMKVLAAKLATRTRLPFWYRDQVVVAQHEPPPLRRQIEALYPDQKILLALSAGAPEPARNRKTSAAVLSTRGRILGFAKIAGSELALRLVRREADLLRSIESITRRPIAPQARFAGEVDGAFVLVQEVLPGKVTSARFTDLHRELLQTMRYGKRQPAAACAMVARLRQELIAHDELQARLLTLLPILEKTIVPSTIVHGDFAPWNLREHRGQLCAFDWEYGEIDGLPFMDELHFHLQIGHEMQGWTPQLAFEYLQNHAYNRPLSLTPRQVQAMQQVHIIDQLARLYGEGYDGSNEMLVWYENLLERLAPVTQEAAVA